MFAAPRFRRWSLGDALALTALGGALLAGLRLGSHPWFDPLNDAATYLLVARSLAEGEGYRLLGEPFAMRPPGFPLLLSLVLARRGTDFAALNLLVGGFGVACVLLLFVFLRPRLGAGLSLLTGLALWFAPGFQRLRNPVMSDVPAAAAMLFCLVVERWSARACSWRREVALGVALGAAAQIRFLLVLLIPAILVARAWQQLALEPEQRRWRAFLARRCASWTTASPRQTGCC